MVGGSKNILQFCVPTDTIVEVWAVANIPAASVTEYVSAMQLQKDSVTVASDTKANAPSAANEDRSFVIFYKDKTTADTQFDLNLIYNTDGTVALNVPEKEMSLGYRTYASGYPRALTAATCPI